MGVGRGIAAKRGFARYGGGLAPEVRFGLGGVIAAGLAGLVLYSAASGHWVGTLGGGLLVAAMSTAAGGGVGFLFGIPRLLSSGAAAHPTDLSATSTASYAPNTNLEQASDWLTKILLGAGLTQIGAVPHRLRQVGDALAPMVGGENGAAGFVATVVVYFSVLGFLSGWLLTRLLLARALSTADRQTLADSVSQTSTSASSLDYTPTEVRKMFDTGVEGLRVQALALLQGKPDPTNLDLIVRAIDRNLSPFELLQALLAAREIATGTALTDEEKAALREAVDYKLRNPTAVPPYSRRRVVGEEILKLLAASAEPARGGATGGSGGTTGGSGGAAAEQVALVGVEQAGAGQAVAAEAGAGEVRQPAG
ncbi:hypothetical protein [Kitasatospora sp. GP82]|uniref:hypothetical protein n=1 Tax=Kitasatospora sp. GP82 TaxID=3035089 RepID=UPI002473E84D|nr:hypothetical protein [Kitasatospora sp. GP82]MDH6128996.1 hypothetical protein [Kitasatospora sp. GP82]